MPLPLSCCFSLLTSIFAIAVWFLVPRMDSRLKEEDNDSNSSDLGSDEERDSNLHLGSAEKDEAEEGSLTFPDYGLFLGFYPKYEDEEDDLGSNH